MAPSRVNLLMAKNLKTLLCIVLVLVMLVGCTPTSNPEGPDTNKAPTLEERLAEYAKLGSSPDDNYRVWYEIFVYSFADSDNNGIGDLKGVISKLDYLQELGVNGIWLMPIHPSTSYHKYNVDDYYGIDPSYGTMADFEALIAECNKRDIKVILDLVVNHSGDQNEWFTTACDYLRNLQLGDFANSEECPYLDYYNFVLANEAPGSGYSRVSGSMYSYECQFSGDMPDLNLDNPKLREDIKNVMKFWLDKGAAGFRVDAAKEFYTGNISKNVEFMSWMQQTVTSIKSDAYMVAEVWDSFDAVTRYYESGFTSIFNYPFGDDIGKLVKVVNGRGTTATVKSWATALETADKAYSGSHPGYIDAPFLSNHDVGRIHGFVNGDPLRIKMAAAMNLFMSGSAFIMYGEEIGMAGPNGDQQQQHPSIRAPMYWSAAGTDDTTTPPPGGIVPKHTCGSLEEQRKDESSVYSFYRELIAVRKALPAISHGKNTAETALNKGCVSAIHKTWNDQECIILMNIDDDEAGAQVDLSAYADWSVTVTLSVNGQAIEQDGTTLKLPAYGIAILTPAK